MAPLFATVTHWDQLDPTHSHLPYLQWTRSSRPQAPRQPALQPALFATKKPGHHCSLYRRLRLVTSGTYFSQAKNQGIDPDVQQYRWRRAFDPTGFADGNAKSRDRHHGAKLTLQFPKTQAQLSLAVATPVMREYYTCIVILSMVRDMQGYICINSSRYILVDP